MARPNSLFKGTKDYLYAYDGYSGGHKELDRIIKLYEWIQAGSPYYFTPSRVAMRPRRWFPHDLESSLDAQESNVV
jgi:hypothetical protein